MIKYYYMAETEALRVKEIADKRESMNLERIPDEYKGDMDLVNTLRDCLNECIDHLNDKSESFSLKEKKKKKLLISLNKLKSKKLL